MGTLDGQVAIVTGGGRGIGRAIARLLAREGARVVIGQRDAASGAQTCQAILDAGGQARYVPTDIAQPDQAQALVTAAVEAYGTVHVLVNNAAITGVNGHLLDVSLETWERVIGANLSGVFYCSQAAARIMALHQRGAIVSISSVNAQVPQPHCCAYAAAKGGLETLTRSMATDLGPYGIRVNAIAPGPIQSRLPDDAPPRPSASTLLGRAGLTEEVAAAALFLVSEAASFITGQTLVVDGGLLINGYTTYGAQPQRPERSK